MHLTHDLQKMDANITQKIALMKILYYDFLNICLVRLM